jgi:hypothetical protein
MPLRLRVAIATALALLLMARVGAAATARIRLLRPADRPLDPAASFDGLVRELTARTAGELVAAGFSVELRDLLIVDTSISQEPTRDVPVDATILIDHLVDGALIEITAGGRVVYRVTVSRAELGGDDGGRVLAAAAVHAVAALQTALSERPSSVKSADAARTPRAVDSIEARAAPRAPRVGVALAGLVLHGIGGIGASFAPSARLSYRATPFVALGLHVSALGSRPTMTALAGTARVRQDLAIGEALLRWRPYGRVHPVLIGGVGLYHLALEGAGMAPYVGVNDSFSTVATSLGAGLWIDITARVSATIESQTLWVWPEPAVKIDVADAGRAGRPSFTHSLGLLVWL